MSRFAWFGYALWAALLVAAYLLVPAVSPAAFAGVVLTTTTAIVVGIWRNRPRRRLPWILLAISNLAFAAGTVTAVFLADVLHQRPFPSVADVIFLGISTPTLILSLLSLTRSGARIRDRASMIDALILTAGAGFLSWTFLISPYLQNPDLTWVEKGISVAYPLSDVLILSILARLAIGARRSGSVVLLLVSGGALLTADVLYGLSELNGSWRLGGPVDIGWAVFLLAAGAAALHPSMAELTEPQVVLRPTEVKLRRMVLGVASLVAPTVLVIESVRGPVEDGVIIAIASALLVLLAIARMSVVATGLRQTMTRERELRRAGEALASATDGARISEVVYAAVAALLPAGTAYRAAFLIHETDPPDTDPPDTDPPESDPPESDPPESDPPESEPQRAPGGPAGAGTVNMRYTRTLPAEIASQLDGFELTLQCPLTLATGRVGDLFVGASEVALVELQEAAQLLAGQAAAIVGNIALNREINRRDSEAYFRTLVLNAADVIVIIDAANRITYSSPSAQPMFQVETLVGRDLFDIVAPALREAAATAIQHVRAGGTQQDVADWKVRRADGDDAEVEVAVRDLRHEPTVAGLVLTMRDVTEGRRLERELLSRAYIDPLTGLGNRLQFQATAQHVVESSVATGAAAGVLLINMDDFRSVNDTMGHAVGDELLIAIGQRLVAAVAGQGSVSRLGADEFGAVIDGAVDTEHIARLAEQVLAAFAAPFLVSGSVMTAQPSIGVATAETAVDGEQLLSQADVALASAKAEATAHWRQYEASLHTQVLQRMKLRTELDQAIANEAFTLYYQPIVNLSTGRPHGVEALVRWLHPSLGMIPPMEFIPLAEESGLIVPLGDWIIRTTLAAAVSWRRALPVDPPFVSVNVSVRQFRAPGFVDRVLDELARSGLPPSLLTLEITESLILGDHEEIHADIARLRRAGIKASIDDFGTGYSSLSYLHRVPVDILKLDKSFVDTISASAQQLNLVRGIIQLAKMLQLDIVAEGIETIADQALLVDAGCKYGQGYLFARPMPQHEVGDWLLARRAAAGRTAPPAQPDLWGS